MAHQRRTSCSSLNSVWKWPWPSWLSVTMTTLTLQSREMTPMFQSKVKSVQSRLCPTSQSTGGLMHIWQKCYSWRMQRDAEQKDAQGKLKCCVLIQGAPLLTGRSQLLQSLSHIDVNIFPRGKNGGALVLRKWDVSCLMSCSEIERTVQNSSNENYFKCLLCFINKNLPPCNC